MIDKRVTIKHVAQEAGVSTQTVSRVMNHRPDVSEETRRRVTAVIARLGYEPSALARSLIHGRSRTLGVVGSALEYYGPVHILVGVEHQAHALGYSLLLSMLHEPGSDEGPQIISDLLSRQVEGILWMAPEIGDSSTWLKDRQTKFPVPVVFTNTQSGEGFSTVSIDNRSGGLLATSYLLEMGCKHVGIIAGPKSWWETRQRSLGWHEALAAAGQQVEERQIAYGDWSAESGVAALEKLLAGFPEMDALFICNDQMALGALQAANRLRRRVPEDLAVIGFDDTPEAPFFSPSLTTVRQPLSELGESAVQELHRLIEARHTGDGETALASLWLQTRLVKRASTPVRVFSHSLV
jgi:DNA-binding LacI/PurR family transcriptional regulator